MPNLAFLKHLIQEMRVLNCYTRNIFGEDAIFRSLLKSLPESDAEHRTSDSESTETKD